MGESGSETNEPIENIASTENSQLKCMDDVRKLDQEELVDYVEELHECIENINKKLTKCRQTIKQLKTKTDGAKKKRVENSADEENKDDEFSANTAFSFVQEMLQAAEQAKITGHLKHDPKSGFLYDEITGYFYIEQYGLFYDESEGNYYRYIPEEKSYEFHSKAYKAQSQDAQVEQYVNSQLLRSFSALNISRMRENALGKSNAANENAGNKHKNDDNAANVDANAKTDSDDDDDDDEVEFDEYGGVITDKHMLKQIKRQKKKDKRRSSETKSKLKIKKSKKKKKDEKSRKWHHKSHKKHRKREKRIKRKKDSKSKELESDNESQSIYALKKKRCRLDEIEDGELSSSSRGGSSNSSTTSTSGSGDSDDDDAGHGHGRGNANTCVNQDNIETDVPIFKAGGRFQDIAKQYPPSLRIVVQETNVDTLKVGSLHLVTYKGGTLGREGGHDVIISDVNVSKCHLKFQYDKKDGIYKCSDLGSRNGTVLNGMRMSESKVESEPCDLVHGSILQIGQTKLLCHVHEGNSTCGLCEPGLLIEKPPRESIATSTVTLTHKEQLKKIQKKYGLEKEKFVEGKTVAVGNYNDRAASRRFKVGSTTDKEKTEVASVNTEISSKNKGYKMLSNMGWSKGKPLGIKDSGGLIEPISVVSNAGTIGLGCEQPSVSVPYTAASKQKLVNLKITQQRYERAGIFLDSDDDSD